MTVKIQTKFGTATKRTDGYWDITSSKEGNFKKLLHRLVFEDFYNIKLDNNTIIHHDDGNKDNNEIWNLVPMTQSEHRRLHNYENNPIHQVKNDVNYLIKLSKAHNNKTGIFRVNIKREKGYAKGFTYSYQYVVDGKKVFIRSVDINKLKEKVLARGLEWIVLDENKAKANGLV